LVQLASVVHEVAHPPATVQVNPLQSWGVPAGQLPLPSQTAAGVKPPDAHAAGTHVVVPPNFSHAPLPSQCPVLPQVVGAAAAPHRP